MSAIQQALMAAGSSSAGVIQTAFILHGDGTNGSTTFVDSGPNAFTFSSSGGAQISTTQSVFGGASMDFTAAGNEASVFSPTSALLGATGDFCFEMRFRMTDVSSLCYFMVADGSNRDLYVSIGNPGVLRISLLGTSYDIATISDGIWYSLCVDRLGIAHKVFLNGSNVLSANETENIGATATWYFGYSYPGFSGYGSGGRCFIDEVRFTKQSLHQTAYTPDTAAFP